MVKISTKKLNLTFPDLKIITKKKYLIFESIKSLDEDNKDSIIWISNEKNIKDKILFLNNCRSKIIICNLNISKIKKIINDKTFIISNNPRLTMFKLSNYFFANSKCLKVPKLQNINKNNFIYTKKIGKQPMIRENVVIYENVEIGKNIYINAGSTLGTEGFSFEKIDFDSETSFERLHHNGKLIIGDNVFIGSNVSICRGNLKSTIIHNNVKINNNVHIGHNVEIGKNVIIMANVTICGSVKIGDNVEINAGSTIRDFVEIGSFSRVGMGSVVTKNIPKKELWFGNPASLKKKL